MTLLSSEKKWSKFILITLLGGIAHLPLAYSEAGKDQKAPDSGSFFPQTLGNVEQTGYKDCEPVRKPKLKWVYQMPGGVASHQWVHPSLGPGNKDLFVVADERLYRINTETGALISELREKFLAHQTVDQKTLYTTTATTLDAYRIDTEKDPEKIWTYTAPSPFQSDSKYCLYDISPTVVENMVLFGCGRLGLNNIWRPSEHSADKVYRNTFLHAVDATSGKELWKLDTKRMLESPVAVDRKRMLGFVYASATKEDFTAKRYIGKLMAVDLKTGTEKWSFDHDENSATFPCYDEDRVYAANRNEIFAVEAETGKDVWRVKRDPPVVEKTHDIAYEGAHNILITPTLAIYIYRGVLNAYHKKDGSLAWTLTTSMKSKYCMGCLYAARDVMYFQEYSPSGSFYAVDLNTGKELWKFQVPEGKNNGARYMSLHNKRIYFGDCNARIYCLEDSE